jgi:hypothetical protein
VAGVIETVAAGAALGGSIWSWVAGLRDLVGEKAILAALFDGGGVRIEGSDRLVVTKRPDVSGRDDRWWFSIVEVPGFLAIAIPVDPSIVTKYGRAGDVKVFQFVEQRMAAHDVPSHPGPFLVVAYRPKALVNGAVTIGSPR